MDFSCTSINSAIKYSIFPTFLKLADVTPVYKKWRKDIKENFRPLSILPILSKFFEKCMFAQISTFFDNIFSNQKCDFRKGYSTQHYLLVMLETWKRSVDKGKVFGALLTDLSKTFDCLDHELLTVACACGFSLPALQLKRLFIKQKTENKNCEYLQYLVRYKIWGSARFNTRTTAS